MTCGPAGLSSSHLCGTIQLTWGMGSPPIRWQAPAPRIRRSCHGCGRCLFEILELKIEENPMTRGLLSCLLVVTFGAPLQAARDEPMDARVA